MEDINIDTDRLLIRNLNLSDVDDFYVYRSNPEIAIYQGFEVMTKEQSEVFIKTQLDKEFGKAGKWVQYGIENKLTKKIIGDCAIRLSKDDETIAEIGVTISHLEQKKGYAKEVIAGILEFLFIKKNIRRVIEIVDEQNIASINLFKSLGFRLEGHFIENVFFKEKWGNEFQYALLKREWEMKGF